MSVSLLAFIQVIGPSSIYITHHSSRPNPCSVFLLTYLFLLLLIDNALRFSSTLNSHRPRSHAAIGLGSEFNSCRRPPTAVWYVVTLPYTAPRCGETNVPPRFMSPATTSSRKSLDTLYVVAFPSSGPSVIQHRICRVSPTTLSCATGARLCGRGETLCCWVANLTRYRTLDTLLLSMYCSRSH
ncbi:hypothetical protein C8R46DRAFT_1138352 [Mycena filopes]|nr:hypothetical protein C8R46DRAFT_1138352 [Mycena filopes]